MSDAILFVDDEPFVLESMKRMLSFDYSIDTAQSGNEALEKIISAGPYAIVVADYRMPQMNGTQFLAKVMSAAPDTVRIMLSGNADLQAAVDAVNEGQVFRFLTKPCDPEVLKRSLEAGLKQFHLVSAEKELQEKTLVGSINMLTEILSMVNPKAYGKSLRIRQLVHAITSQLNLPGAWQYVIAAALSQLGWILFTPELLNKIAQNRELSVDEQVLYSRHPFTSRKLLEKIPRLESISRIIEGQNRSIDDLCLDATSGAQYFVDLGSHILNICVDYDRLIQCGMSHADAMAMLYADSRLYKPEILESLKSLKSTAPAPQSAAYEVVTVDNLEIGMLIVEPVLDHGGNLLMEKNTTVSHSVIVQLYKLSSRPGLVIPPIKVVRR